MARKCAKQSSTQTTGKRSTPKPGQSTYKRKTTIVSETQDNDSKLTVRPNGSLRRDPDPLGGGREKSQLRS